MTLQDVQQTLSSMALVNCMPNTRGEKTAIEFSETPPVEPGVYVIYLKYPYQAFYVGEAGNLRQRLTYLFRCYRNENPHPCHLRHQEVWAELPECDQFCRMYGVRWCSTKGAFGRLEAEEGLQSQHGTNLKAFYMNFGEKIASNESIPPMSSPETEPAASLASPLKVVPPPACSAVGSCGGICPVWRELTTNPDYQLPEGFEVPTMTGRRENLRFQSQQKDGVTVIRVWRVVGNLDFTFDEEECRTICKRFAQGLQEGRTFVDEGTSYFNDLEWTERPLNIINAPYAAAVIRHARQCVGLPI